MDEKAEYRVVAVITRGAADAQLMVEPVGTDWRLPVFTIDDAADSRALAPALRAAVAARFGLAVAVLSVLQARRGEPGTPRDALVALDAFTVPKDGTEPSTAAWLSNAQLHTVSFTDDGEDARVRQWLSDLTSRGGHALRLPWTHPGWLAGAGAWIEATLAAHGLAQAGPIDQHRTWSLSALLRAPLAEGCAYFKALPPIFAAEPRITQALAQRFPEQLPAVIATDDERGWLLMREFTGPLLQSTPDLLRWVDALRGYARLQIATASDPDALLTLGCPDRRLAVLPAQFAAVLADAEHLLLGQANGLTPAQIDELHVLAPLLPAACQALDDCGLPNTLEHGDLHGSNIALTPSGPVYFDWSDACLAHPFTCLTTFLETVDPAWHAPLTAAYLEEWGAFAAPGVLQRAHRLSQPLGAAHLAVSYHRIVAAIEPGQRWQLAGGVPFFLREVLKYKAALISPH